MAESFQSLSCKVCLGIFFGGLLAACIMDIREQMVYRFVWLFCGVSAGWLLVHRILKSELAPAKVVVIWGELIIFMVLQQVWFARFYGRADCHAFCVCAVMITAMGRSFSDYVIHMLISFMELITVQLVRRNIAKNGNLKVPVPMIPYIVSAFWLWVDFMGRK